jgi:myo-inositol catabolism protein IolC
MESMAQQHGFDQALYILPFDQRGSFQTGMFGWRGRLSAAKQVIYDAFRASITIGNSAGKTGVLVDEQFGAAILRDARSRGYITARPVEKSGQEEFAFEYGDDFKSHIEDVNPTFCKVLVRYNPHGDMSLNQRQAMKLRALSDYLLASNRKLMFELLVPPEEQQLAEVGGDKKTYDVNLRPKLMVQVIEQLQDAHVEPDIWRLEGLGRVETARPWWQWLNDMAVRVSDALFWAVEKMNKGSERGCGQRRKLRDSSVSPWAARRFGARS